MRTRRRPFWWRHVESRQRALFTGLYLGAAPYAVHMSVEGKGFYAPLMVAVVALFAVAVWKLHSATSELDHAE